MDWSTRAQEYLVCHAPTLLNVSLKATRPFMSTAPIIARGVLRLPQFAIQLLTLHLFSSGFAEPDKRALAAHPNFTLKLLPEVLRDCVAQGTEGLFRDMRLTSLPWSFKPSGISTPLILLFQGEDDITVPRAMGEFLAKLLGPKCKATYFPGEGHLSLLLNRGQDVFDILSRALEEAESSTGGTGG
jgi:pimeloyl-ACP methyl ester carboxylesterase